MLKLQVKTGPPGGFVRSSATHTSSSNRPDATTSPPLTILQLTATEKKKQKNSTLKVSPCPLICGITRLF